MAWVDVANISFNATTFDGKSPSGFLKDGEITLQNFDSYDTKKRGSGYLYMNLNWPFNGPAISFGRDEYIKVIGGEYDLADDLRVGTFRRGEFKAWANIAFQEWVKMNFVSKEELASMTLEEFNTLITKNNEDTQLTDTQSAMGGVE